MPAARDPITRYLARYAEPEATDVVLDGHYRCAIVVPVFAEATDWHHSLFDNGPPDGCLLIAVINAPDHLPADHPDLHATTQLLANQRDGCFVVDRVTQPLPQRSGVGLARKIGTDIALSLYASGQLESPWVYQTDADARLPANYLDQPLPAAGAVVFAHRHRSADPLLTYAAALYDTHMRYYVDGLRRAGSPYAHKSLGSTIAVHAHDYAVVRGFPKRNAAEDFYLLNKLAKVTTVTSIDDVVVDLEARLSQRVPFGTGPALAKITEQLRHDPSGRTYCSYHPASFQLLCEGLRALRELARTKGLRPHPASSIIEDLGLARVSDNILARYATPERRLQALNDWFDGLKTLRFMHAARTLYPDQPLLQSVPRALEPDAVADSRSAIEHRAHRM